MQVKRKERLAYHANKPQVVRMGWWWGGCILFNVLYIIATEVLSFFNILLSFAKRGY